MQVHSRVASRNADRESTWLIARGLVAGGGGPLTQELVGEDRKTYQLEIQAFWDSKKGGDVRLIVAADDGGSRAFKPLTGDFIMRPDRSLV
jgi:hypothetical protein